MHETKASVAVASLGSNQININVSSYCEEKNTLENLCSQIPGDAQLYSLFRIDAQPEDCPFKGAPFTFTYNRGHGECKNPVSFVDTCTEPSRLLLRYQACPDVQKTESTGRYAEFQEQSSQPGDILGKWLEIVEGSEESCNNK
ncbi:hypothetical protein Ocin01_08534 [Orchesella cincta]|uniref:DUF7042 domain-containing protein n=1 Tax=Orchesella cincta TaxID=48709 RepID=A0A1D2MYY6_ORCCI|nr:hypothetical protein Ocin01_08534 [Orchesella cincta]